MGTTAWTKGNDVGLVCMSRGRMRLAVVVACMESAECVVFAFSTFIFSVWRVSLIVRLGMRTPHNKFNHPH